MKTIILLITLVLCNLSFGCEILPNGNYIPCNTEGKIFEYEFKRFAYDKASIRTVIPQPPRSFVLDKNFFNDVIRLWNITDIKLGIYKPEEYLNFLKELDKLISDIFKTDKYDTEKMAQLKIRFENLKAESKALISTASGREKFPQLPYIKNNKN